MVIFKMEWLACKTDISEDVRMYRSNVISQLFVVLRPHTLIPNHSFYCIHTTCNNHNGHIMRCPELVSGTKALQFVIFGNFLSLTENAGEHWSKGTGHKYRVHISWPEWSRTTIFHSKIVRHCHFQHGMASMQNWHFWRSEKVSI